MHTMSMDQALSIWSDLERVYYNDRDEVEIYVMRALPYSNFWHNNKGPIGQEESTRLAREANRALFELFSKFSQDRGVQILVDGQELGEWMVDPGFRHRWRVQVVRDRTKWQPIETAPKNGQRILGYVVGTLRSESSVVRWAAEEWWGDDRFPCEVTHWQPLPKDPEEGVS